MAPRDKIILQAGECPTEGTWSAWYSRDNNQFDGDENESLMADQYDFQGFIIDGFSNYGTDLCMNPVASQARPKNDPNDGWVADPDTLVDTTEIVDMQVHGPVCIVDPVDNPRCSDLEVRFCCKPPTGKIY